MGQGLYTKTLQVASKVLNVPIDTVHIMETATDKVSGGMVGSFGKLYDMGPSFTGS